MKPGEREETEQEPEAGLGRELRYVVAFHLSKKYNCLKNQL